MAHADDGGPVASAQPVELRRYFDTLLQFWRYGHERIGRRLRLELDGSVPEVLTTDPTRLRQLMDAFIERLGEGEAPISLRVTVQGDCLCIDIVSTATGQVLRERRDRRRALLQRWAAAIEADITPCQAEGVSGFTLRLPLRQEVSDAHYCVPAAEQQLPDRGFNEENRPRLLVVDDIETNRVVLCQMLEVIGCDSDIACDGREAVDKALSERFDGVLMDILMPRMSGLEAVAELRRQPAVAALPVVAITAHTNREELGELTRQGFSAALAKPVNRQQLAAILLELLDGERRRAEEHSPAVTGSSVTSLSPPGVEAMPSSAPAVDEEHFRAIFA
ncbi:MAG: response regulator, partial [Pseudomonadota bacterium]|nr:response regulator [Pseudomonadota bacterium]